MTDERWNALMDSDTLALTDEELAKGWHWCGEFDGLLVGPTMEMEWDVCTCFTKEDKDAKTAIQ